MKKNFGAQIWLKGTKIGPETSFFYHFLKFGLLIFVAIAYNDSLQQCVTCSRSKILEKIFLGGQNWSQN